MFLEQGKEGIGLERRGRGGGRTLANFSTPDDKGKSEANRVHPSPRSGRPKGESTGDSL